MGLLSKAFEKYAESTAKRDDACVEVDSFISKTQDALIGSNEFIGIEWALKKKTEIEKLSREIEYKVNTHNDKVAFLWAQKAREVIGIVEGRRLDDQQMKCIVKPMPNHLVIAGAGTGKTTTIVGKVKYLLNSKQCEPKDMRKQMMV